MPSIVSETIALLFMCLCPLAARAGIAPGTQVKHSLTVTDPDARLGQVERTFQLALPYATLNDGITPDPTTPFATLSDGITHDPTTPFAPRGGTNDTSTLYPVLWYFHGQFGRSNGAAAFSKLGASKGFITVAPQGLGDGSLGIDTTWSVKAEGRNDVCKRVLPQFVMSSCRAVKRVASCNWATCYDDVHFIKTLISTLTNDLKLPADTNRMYMTGLSNGGMMIDYLQTQMPGTWLAAAPWYGAYLTSYLTDGNQATLKGASLLALHGEQDKLIPPGGGLDTQAHYYYISETEAVSRWARANGCSTSPRAITTPYAQHTGQYKHSCVEYPGCSTGAVVAYCSFPLQAHGFWPTFGENMTLWFFGSKMHHAKE